MPGLSRTALILCSMLMAFLVTPESAFAARPSGLVTCTRHGCSDVRPMQYYRYGGEAVSPRVNRKRGKARAVRARSGGSSYLISIQCGPRQVKVAATAAAQFRGFCADLYPQFKFSAVGGWRPGKCWTGGKHPCGGALDVAQTCRSRGPGHCLPRNFPVALSDRLAEKYGLQSGCRWGHRDCGHFEIKGALASNGWTPKTAGAIAALPDDAAPRRWPIAYSEIDRAPAMQGDDLLAKLRPVADAAIWSIYSEVPPTSPQERPVAVLLASMGDVPAAAPKTEVDRAAQLFKLSPDLMRSFARIESGFDPRQRTGSYKGLFQLSDHEFRKYGTGNIYAARDNAIAAANKFKTEEAMFIHAYGREPSFSDLYLIHQQGWAGADKHVSHPDDIAWRNMCKTEEGKSKGVRWCKRAIWGNVPAHFKRLVKGGVDALTSNAFVAFWRARVDQLASTALASSDYSAAVKPPAKKKRYAKKKRRRHVHYAAVR